MADKFFKLLNQALHFFLISGVGWLMDMLIYSILSNFIPVMVANIISSSVAVTYVYIVSTKKIFENTSKINIKTKYVFYILYQLGMILGSSFVIGKLTNFLIKNINIKFILKYAKICAKILVTPFTMVINFIFMKFLIEKV